MLKSSLRRSYKLGTIGTQATFGTKTERIISLSLMSLRSLESLMSLQKKRPRIKLMKRILANIVLAFILMFPGAVLQAYQPYHATIRVGLASATIADPNLVDLSRDLKTTTLELLIPFYTPTTAVAIDLDLRGIDTLMSFAENSTTLVVQIPQADTVQTFQGATRDASIQLFKDYVRDGGTHHRLLRAYARYSPIDPIAGNPNSLMAQMAQADYLVGRLSPLSGCDCSWSAQPIVHQFQTGLNVGRAFSKEFDTTIVTLPLRYSYSPNLDWAFILDAPFSYYRNGGASSVFGSIGLGLRVPMTHHWSFTSILRAGSGGSLDLCTSGSFASAGLMSVYNYKIKEFVLTMTNYAGYITSTNFWLTGINFNYHLHNYIFKNGLSLTSCQGVIVCGRTLNFGISFIDSYFAKDRLYIKHYDEIGVTLITTGLNSCLDYDCLSLGFAYQFGQKNYKGYQLNLAYQF